MNVLHTIKAILWAFFGVRKKSAYQEDLGKLNPFAIIAVALVIVGVFVVALIALANWAAK